MPKQKQLCLDWQPHKAELQNLYLVQDQPLEQLMRYMEETHGFRATYVFPVYSFFCPAFYCLLSAEKY